MSRRSWLGGIAWVLGCGPDVALPADESDSDVGTTFTSASTASTSTTTTTSDPDGSDDGVIIDDFGPWGETGACPPGDPACTFPLDVLVVVDNSGTMGTKQLALARAMPELVQQLTDLMEAGRITDVHVMFTTTDMGSMYCEPFQPPGYLPALGAPIATGCNSRIDDFTGLGSMPAMVPEVCTSVCPSDLVPRDDFVAFDLDGANVLDVPPADIDGDGVLDPPVAQSLACLAPQGINGCGYEAPLEAMVQALDPAAAWNQGDGPFYRPEAALAIVIVSDETDCSLADETILADANYQDVNPDTGTYQLSSAACWNAGVECDGPDALGFCADCTTIENYGIHAISRYTQYLADELAVNQGKPVFMLSLVGVPQSGVEDLVYRDWQEGQYPAGDILPAEWAAGTNAADKQFDFGMGPACTGTNAMGGFIGQAIPSPRVVEVCQSLDGVSPSPGCCVASVCDAGYESAFACLAGLVEVG